MKKEFVALVEETNKKASKEKLEEDMAKILGFGAKLIGKGIKKASELSGLSKWLDAKVKKFTETYLVEAMSVTEAEAKVIKDFTGYTMDFEVKSVTESRIVKIIE
jgi:hypothetical protein